MGLSLRAFASLRAVRLFLRALAVIKFVSKHFIKFPLAGNSFVFPELLTRKFVLHQVIWQTQGAKQNNGNGNIPHVFMSLSLFLSP